MGLGENFRLKIYPTHFISNLYSHRQIYVGAISLEAISNVQSHLKRLPLNNN